MSLRRTARRRSPADGAGRRPVEDHVQVPECILAVFAGDRPWCVELRRELGGAATGWLGRACLEFARAQPVLRRFIRGAALAASRTAGDLSGDTARCQARLDYAWDMRVQRLHDAQRDSELGALFGVVRWHMRGEWPRVREAQVLSAVAVRILEDSTPGEGRARTTADVARSLGALGLSTAALDEVQVRLRSLRDAEVGLGERGSMDR